MGHARLFLMGVIGLTLTLGQIALTQEKKPAPKKPAPIAPAEKLEEGWDEIDDRLIFLMVRLANTEASLEAVEKAIAGSGRKQAKSIGEAKRSDKKNEDMDRRGGGPVKWNVFYGTTAEKFFYHPTDRNTTYHTETILSQKPPKDDNQTGPGIPSRQGLPVHQRPPQFDYIYKANETAKARAEEETDKLRGKLESLLARRQRLEADQSRLWVEIAFRAVAHYDLHKKPIYRFEPVVNGPDTESRQHAEVMKSGALFMRLALSIIDAAEKDQAATFSTIKSTVSQAREKLDDTLLRQGVDVTDKKIPEAKFAALAKRLEDVASNLSDSYEVAVEGDQEQDQQRKDTFRGLLQESLVGYAQIILALDEMSAMMKDEWKIKPDLDKPISFASVASVASVANAGSVERVENGEKVGKKVESERDTEKPSARDVKVSAALLKKKLKGKASYNATSGELVLIYDFKDKSQLQDFDLRDAEVSVANQILRIGGAETISHIVSFQAGTISGTFAPGNLGSIQTLISTSSNASLNFDKGDELGVYIYSGGKQLGKQVFEPTLPLVVRFDVSESKVRAILRNREITGRVGGSNAAGRFVLYGATGGLKVSSLVISGIPEKEWLREFLAD
ncbi:MAG: hypothetical protein NTZ32_11490 [Planctomycetales bacterium]|nr:hypothetical protein [Planctomycetales bacterium]